MSTTTTRIVAFKRRFEEPLDPGSLPANSSIHAPSPTMSSTRDRDLSGRAPAPLLCADDNQLHAISQCRGVDLTFAFEYGVVLLVPAILSAAICVFTLLHHLRRRNAAHAYSHGLSHDTFGKRLSITGWVQILLAGVAVVVSAASLATTPKSISRTEGALWPHAAVLAAREFVLFTLVRALRLVTIKHRCMQTVSDRTAFR